MPDFPRPQPAWPQRGLGRLARQARVFPAANRLWATGPGCPWSGWWLAGTGHGIDARTCRRCCPVVYAAGSPQAVAI